MTRYREDALKCPDCGGCRFFVAPLDPPQTDEGGYIATVAATCYACGCAFAVHMEPGASAELIDLGKDPQ